MLVPIRTDKIKLLLSFLLELLIKNFKLSFVIKHRNIIEPNNLISVVRIGVKSLSNKTKRDNRAAITAQNTERNEYIYLSNELLLINNLESLSKR